MKTTVPLVLLNGPLVSQIMCKMSIAGANLEAMDKSRHWKIEGCSAYTGEGLLEGFDWLVQDVASGVYMLV
ncbi:hypothetical protein V6N11_044001 [Hibiscus sabdariffa]|uniref:Uncharacterized protein n=1 Tax=Hibiscus sabdariffa TaxID=183260 RepID=A0ABR2RE13_9ROSI